MDLKNLWQARTASNEMESAQVVTVADSKNLPGRLDDTVEEGKARTPGNFFFEPSRRFAPIANSSTLYRLGELRIARAR